MQEKIIALVDFGSSKISASLAIIHDDCEILGSASVQSLGIHKGEIVDEEKCYNSFIQSMSEIQKTAGKDVSNVFAGLNLKNLRISEITRKTKIKEEKITSHDIKRVLKKAAESTLINDDEQVADIVINFYKIDNKVVTENVVGWIGNELEIDCNVIVGKAKELNKYKQIIEKAGFMFCGFYVNQIAARSIFLRDNDSMGLKALVDIGADTTNISVFSNGELKAISFRALGSTNITKDLSICGEISNMQAEQIKCINSGCYKSLYDDKSKGDEISIGTYKFSKELYYQVVNARIEELLKFVKLDLKNTSFYEGLCSIIIYGDGIIYFENVKDIAKKQIQKKCTIATNKYLGMKKTSNITSLAGIEEVYNKLSLLGGVSTSFEIEPINGTHRENNYNEKITNNISFDLNNKHAEENDEYDAGLENEMYAGSENVTSRRILREKEKNKSGLLQKVKRMLEDIFLREE